MFTFPEVAASLDLWREYADPERAVSDEEFAEMTIEQRIELLNQVWGPEQD